MNINLWEIFTNLIASGKIDSLKILPSKADDGHFELQVMREGKLEITPFYYDEDLYEYLEFVFGITHRLHSI